MKFHKIKIELLEWLIIFNIGLIIFLIFTHFFTFAKIEGDSMAPTYKDGQYVLGMKEITNIERNDVIAFSIKGSTGDDEYHIKRVVGTPGDVIRITEDELFVNDELLIDGMTPAYNIEYVETLDADEYFVIGDNYEVSNDSRYHGPISKDDIFVKMIFSHDNISDYIPAQKDIKRTEEREDEIEE